MTRQPASSSTTTALPSASMFAALMDDEAQPWEVDDPSDAGDTAIEQGDRVSVFPPGAWQPRMATVLAVRGDGMYLVHMAFGCTKWMWERDIQLRVKALDVEAVNGVEEAG